MRRRRTLTTSQRSSVVALAPEAVWSVVASGRVGPQWYVDAAPLRFRAGLDRLVGGHHRWPPPGRELLATGDHAGFWLVVEADADARRLVLEAEVRAPGRVRLQTVVDDVAGTAEAADAASQVTQTISFAPDGVLGTAYLLADLPAREVVAELTMLHLLTTLRRPA